MKKYFFIILFLFISFFSFFHNAKARCDVRLFFGFKQPNSSQLFFGEQPPSGSVNLNDPLLLRAEFAGCSLNYAFQITINGKNYDNTKTIAVTDPQIVNKQTAFYRQDYGDFKEAISEPGTYNFQLKVYNPENPDENFIDTAGPVNFVRSDPCFPPEQAFGSVSQVNQVQEQQSVRLNLNLTFKEACVQEGLGSIQVETNFYHYKVGDSASAAKLLGTQRKNINSKTISFPISPNPSALGYKIGDKINFFAFYQDNDAAAFETPKKYQTNSVVIGLGVDVPPGEQPAGRKYCLDKSGTCVDLGFVGSEAELDAARKANWCVGTAIDITDTCKNIKPDSGKDPNEDNNSDDEKENVSEEFTIENPLGEGYDNIEDLVKGISKWIIRFAIPIAFIIILYGGIMMLTAGANPKNFEKGKQALTYAILGLSVIFIGRGFITLIQSILKLAK